MKGSHSAVEAEVKLMAVLLSPGSGTASAQTLNQLLIRALLKLKSLGDGEMELSVLTVLAEKPGSGPGTHITIICNFSSMGFDTLL